MTDPAVQRIPGLEWSVASQPVPGEAVSGDEYVVAPFPDGTLIAVIDGLGHGSQATLAARKAVQTLLAQPDGSVVALLQKCHEALRDTRGAAMTLVAVTRREGTAAAVGVGNVEAVVVRAEPGGRSGREGVLLRNGVVGYQLPALQATQLAVAAGDVLVFATDGVREDFSDDVSPREPLPRLVGRIMATKFRGTDDALVLACKVTDDEG